MGVLLAPHRVTRQNTAGGGGESPLRRYVLGQRTATHIESAPGPISITSTQGSPRLLWITDTDQQAGWLAGCLAGWITGRSIERGAESRERERARVLCSRALEVNKKTKSWENTWSAARERALRWQERKHTCRVQKRRAAAPCVVH